MVWISMIMEYVINKANKLPVYRQINAWGEAEITRLVDRYIEWGTYKQ